MTHHVVGSQKLMFIPRGHYGSNADSAMGGAITRRPSLQQPGQLSRHSARAAEGRRGELHQVFGVLPNVSDSVQFLKEPLIKKFNRRLNHIIQSVCFLFQTHSCRTIRTAGPRPVVLHTQLHTLSHTKPHRITFFLPSLLSFPMPVLHVCSSPSAGSDDVSGRQHMCRIISRL